MDISSGDYIQLLEKLIETPSFSREEEMTAQILKRFFDSKSIDSVQIKNNIIVQNKAFDPAKPTILLNSHHDTVKPGASWKKDPFTPIVVDGKLYGLGSNDAGAPLVSLIAAFIHFYESKKLKYNLILAATAEEEISGRDGVELVLPELGTIDFAVVGEPTSLKMAVAEKGLMVLDCIAKGRGGHAARDEGDNAIYKAIRDIEWFQNFKFDKTSEKLGDVKMSVTDECRFVVDIRSTDVYTNDEILNVVKQNVTSDVVARSTRLQPSGLKNDHLLFDVAKKLKIETFGSPTLSDQALMPFPSVKIGPGDSARSHTADEYIHLKEIEDGIQLYINLLKTIIV